MIQEILHTYDFSKRFYVEYGYICCKKAIDLSGLNDNNVTQSLNYIKTYLETNKTQTPIVNFIITYTPNLYPVVHVHGALRCTMEVIDTDNVFLIKTFTQYAAEYVMNLEIAYVELVQELINLIQTLSEVERDLLGVPSIDTLNNKLANLPKSMVQYF